MSKPTFFKYLAGIAIILLSLVFAIHGRGEIGKFSDFSIYAIIAFSFLSYVMYTLGLKAARSSNKYMFNNIIVGNMLLKMIMCVAIVFIYKKIYHIESRAFLLPFLLIYLTYTIFETYFLTKLAKGD